MTMCNCVTLANRELAKHNTEICRVDTISMKTGQFERRMTVPTTKIDSRKRGTAMKVFATFCPMCGEKYPETGNTSAAPSACE